MPRTPLTASWSFGLPTRKRCDDPGFAGGKPIAQRDQSGIAEFCGPSRLRSNCGAKNSLPFWRIFCLDRLGHGVSAFKAEEGISTPRDAKNQGFAAILRSDLFKLFLPALQGVVPKKP